MRKFAHLLLQVAKTVQPKRFFDKTTSLGDEFQLKVRGFLSSLAARLRKAAGKDPQIFGRPLGSARTFKLVNYQARNGFQLGKG